MDQVTDLNNWKAFLAKFEETDYRIAQEDLEALENLFNHLPTQTALRLQKEYESATIKSNQLFGEMFDKIDLSDKAILCSYLKMMRLFGFFRLAQITYHVQAPQDEFDPDPIYLPSIEKVKWYDLRPLLPAAGTIGWRAIMNHGLVKEEQQLLPICLQLLMQKLQYYTIILSLDQFRNYAPTVRKNGAKVAEKLFEMIRDVAYDDESMIGLDASLFNLLVPFTDEVQQAAIIEAAVQDLFKPYQVQKPIRSEEVDKIFEIIDECIMDNSKLQSLLFSKVIEHLRCNIIRRKRRHSVESTFGDGGSATLEDLISGIEKSQPIKDLLPSIEAVDLLSKKFQCSYATYWTNVLDRIISDRTLTSQNSLRVIGVCSILLIVASKSMSQDLIDRLTILMAKSVDNTTQFELTRLFNACDPDFMIEMTKKLSECTELMSSFDTPVQKFYKTYLNRYLKACMMRSAKQDAIKFNSFVTFICDKNVDRYTSHLLQSISIHALADCLENTKHNRNAVADSYLECARICSRKLYKFVKKHSCLKIEKTDDNEIENETMDTSNQQGSDENELPEAKKIVVIDALVCILRIAIGQNDQELLDSYSDLLLKVFSFVTIRIEELVLITKSGSTATFSPIDDHLPRLLMLYMAHRNTITTYLNYDLIGPISCLLIIDKSAQINGVQSDTKNCKKVVYNHLKTKLRELEERAQKSSDVYFTIINKQFNSVEQSIGSNGDIKREKSCCHNYSQHMRSISTVSAIILSNCSQKNYSRILRNTVECLEQCDPFDHSMVLYLILILESLVPSQIKSNDASAIGYSQFRDMLPRISCCLIRIAKSVELGPSIHAFTNSGCHKSNISIQSCTYTICIKIYTTIFCRYPPKATESLITDAMQICVSSNLIQYAKYSIRLHRYFIQLCSAISGLLRSICKNKEILMSSLPVFLTVLEHLIRCLIMASDRQKLERLIELPMNGHGTGDNIEGLHNNDIMGNKRKNYEVQLELLALDVGRTLNNLSTLRVKLVDYAPHLISSYIKDVQRASCPEFVRLHLNEGMFRIFNLIDAHQKERQEEVVDAGVQRKTIAGRASGSLFEMIHARLDQASREIFRDLHDNYNRFHRYQAKC